LFPYYNVLTVCVYLCFLWFYRCSWGILPPFVCGTFQLCTWMYEVVVVCSYIQVSGYVTLQGVTKQWIVARVVNGDDVSSYMYTLVLYNLQSDFVSLREGNIRSEHFAPIPRLVRILCVDFVLETAYRAAHLTQRDLLMQCN
jgi:hypothetical protein